MEHVIVERVFAEHVDVERFAALSREGASCFAMRNVRPLRTWLAADGKRMICEYLAPDAESVRVANELAGLPFERAWTGRFVEHG